MDQLTKAALTNLTTIYWRSDETDLSRSKQIYYINLHLSALLLKFYMNVAK